MLKNILTVEIVTNVAVDKLLCCMTGVTLLMLNLSMINSEKLFWIYSTINKISWDDLEFGFWSRHERWGNQKTENGYHWGSPLRSYFNMGSPNLHSIWTMIVTWGRVSNHKLDLSTKVVPTNKWKGSETSPQIKTMPLYWFHCLGEKDPLKEA